jgi:hypothetical protein
MTAKSQNNELLIGFDAPSQNDSKINWTGWMIRPGGKRHIVCMEFDFPDDAVFQPSVHPWLLAFIMAGMRLGLAVRVPYPVDSVLLNNLMEFQEVWACWSKDRLNVVPIRVEECVTAFSGNDLAREGAITAFSGGVDSCFTCVRHTKQNTNGYRSIPLKAGLMVHGFDIPLADANDYHGALERSRRILTSHGLQCLSMKTELRKLCGILDMGYSEETHGAFLAACLMCYENVFSMAVIPSTYTYTSLRLPWGSTPITDELLGTRQMPVVHDGAAYNKFQKVEWFGDNASIAESLRVCWEGHRFDRNCGKCFKCVATQVCFWLCGVSAPPCFPVICSLAEVELMHLASDQNKNLFAYMAAEAEIRGSTEIHTVLVRCLERNNAPVRADRVRWLRQRWLRLGRRVMPSRW